MNYEEFKKYVDKMNENIFNKLKDNNDEQFFYVQLVKRFNEICSEQLESEQKCKKQKEAINKIDNYINNYDVFKVFSFPLMKRWEEQQVKSSIDYEFKTSLVKDLKDILKEVSE